MVSRKALKLDYLKSTKHTAKTRVFAYQHIPQVIEPETPGYDVIGTSIEIPAGTKFTTTSCKVIGQKGMNKVTIIASGNEIKCFYFRGETLVNITGCDLICDNDVVIQEVRYAN